MKGPFVFCGALLMLFSLEAEQATYSQRDSQGVPFDQMLREILYYDNGIFVEVGAHDGVSFSNTKLFEEEYGWTGILIEPSPALFFALCHNRPHSQCFSCALGSFDEDSTYGYGDFDGRLMSSFTGRAQKPNTTKVLIRSLQSILDECEITHINFLSLDTEGYELNILQGIDFTKTTIDYLLVEIYSHHYNKIVSFLSDQGYVLVRCFSNYNTVDNPHWDGTHNDYLFKKKGEQL